MNRERRPLWIISGFLGTGKTTLLNHLLREFAPGPVGVLINDFGALGVDAHLISREGRTRVVELNGGQIFCSCISGSFVDSLVELSLAPVEGILVEASGMAKPRALGPILEEAEKRSDERFYYAGMVTVVDAERFEKMRATVNAVEEQIVYGDLLVINKCDSVGEERVASIARTIRRLNPHCGILRTSFGRMRRGELPEGPVDVLHRRGPGGEEYRGWEEKKPVAVTWNPPKGTSLAALREQLLQKAATALRIKGYVETTDGPVFVSAVGDTLTLEEVSEIPGAAGLTEFYPRSGEKKPAAISLSRIDRGEERCRT